MRRFARANEAGQASVEHVGLIVLAALLFGAIAAATPLASLGDEVAAAIGGTFSPRSDPHLAAAAPVPEEPKAIVDRYLAADLDTFLAYRVSPDRDPRLDYSTDHCSAPLVGSSGASFDFSDACLRHDFGYRNYDRLGIFAGRKAAVDDRFLADMRDHCAARPPADHDRCFAWARVFYEAVSRLGFLSGHG
jgi:hypothetical protein